METDISAGPQTQIVSEAFPEHEKDKPKAAMGIMIGAIAATLLSVVARNWLTIVMALAGQQTHLAQIAYMVGTLIGVVLFPAVVVLLFQIGKRYRNPRSRWAIYFYTSLFLLLCNILSMFTSG